MKPASAMNDPKLLKQMLALSRLRERKLEKDVKALGEAAGPQKPVVCESNGATTSMFPSEGKL